MTDHAPQPDDPFLDLLDLVDHGRRAAAAYGRPDLGSRLDEVHRRLREPTVNVVVVGEFKQGKSSFINALLNASVCPVDDDIATAVPTSIRHGDERAAWALTRPAESTAPVDPDHSRSDRREIPFEQIAEFATEHADDPSVVVDGVEVTLPRRLLAGGLTIVDTPGVGGLGSAHATAALGALSVADAAIFLSDASQEYTRAEMDFLGQARELCPMVVCGLTKTDFYPAWRTVLELNRGHLDRAGVDAALLPLSSTLRVEAIARDDRRLNRESGYPELTRLLAEDIVGGAARREAVRARDDVLAVVDQLTSSFENEERVLADPEASAELTRRLEDARQRSDQLRSQTARWSTTLNDGVADLTSDVDHDFRQRVRNVLAEADAAIDHSDPLETWSEFEPWLAQRLSYEVVSNYRHLLERSDELNGTVGGLFTAAGGTVLADLEIDNTAQALGRVSISTELELTDNGGAAKGLTILRGSYSGILMFTMLGSMVGVALGPIAVGIGLAMGRKSLKDEKERQKTQRRAQAKNLVRKYCDEVSFQVNKDTRDTLRRTQRQIRDFYTARAEELHRSASESLAAAQQAARSDDRERSTRLRDVRSELERLRHLRARATSFDPIRVGPGASNTGESTTTGSTAGTPVGRTR